MKNQKEYPIEFDGWVFNIQPPNYYKYLKPEGELMNTKMNNPKLAIQQKPNFYTFEDVPPFKTSEQALDYAASMAKSMSKLVWLRFSDKMVWRINNQWKVIQMFRNDRTFPKASFKQRIDLLSRRDGSGINNFKKNTISRKFTFGEAVEILIRSNSK